MTNKGLLISYSSTEIFKLIAIIVIITYTINKIHIHFSVEHLFSLIISVCIVVYYKKNVNNNQINKYNIFNDDMLKYKYLFLDVEIISIYNNLHKYKKFNQNAFNDSLVSVNKIMKFYYNFHKRKMISERKKLSIIIYNQITNMDLFKKQSTDSLLSIIVNVPVEFVESDFSPSSKYIEQQTQKLYNLLSLKIRECCIIYKEKYINNENINSSSHIHNFNFPLPDPINSYNYLSNYNLY